jgi:Flp pilus assembly protein TadG
MRRASWRPDEHGSAILIVAVWLTLLLFLGMSVDYGILLRYRRGMQNACDSGALAGGLYLRSKPSSAGSTAVRYATSDMTQNNLASNQNYPAAATTDSNNQPNTTNPTRVKVDIQDTVPTYFYRLVTQSVTVGIECTSAVEAVTQTSGIVPVAMDLGQFQANVGQPCTAGDLRPVCQTDFFLDAGQNKCGSGNSCLLDLTNSSCSGGGATEWGCVFANGSTQSVCSTTATQNPPACSQISGTPGGKNGGLDKGIPPRCQTPAPPDPASQWIVMVPLVSGLFNSSNCQGNNCTWTVGGFAAFQLDCPNMPSKFTGNQVRIPGKFIYFIDMAGTGSPTATDNGLETVRLIQ